MCRCLPQESIKKDDVIHALAAVETVLGYELNLPE